MKAAVAEKWTGTQEDKQDMEKLQLSQVVRRNFGRIAMFGFASTLICTWEIVLGALSLSLPNGGTAGLFWNYIIVVVGFGMVYASIAELGSVIPTSGGQYYWVSVLAPRRYHKYLSYVTGWLCTTAWQTGISSSAFLAGTIIQGLFVLNIPGYQFKAYHGTLLVIGIAFFAIIFNTILAKKLPLIEGLLVFLHILGVVIVIPLWVLAPLRDAHSVFVDFTNNGGWSTDGLSMMIGMLPVALSLLGLDCSVHMAEETKDSSRTLPVSLMLGFIVNALLGFFVLVTVIFTLGDIETILATPTGYPFLQIFYNTTKSLTGTNIMAAVIIINLTASSIAVLATASRQLWAFARNKGLPFSSILAPAILPHQLPLNALFVSLVITILLSLINIGSSAALNAIYSLNAGSLLTSYMITIGCMLFRRLQGHKLPPSRWSLGRWGLPINIGAMCYLLPVYVFSFFPGVVNPTPVTMNWGIVMYGGVVIFSTLYYIFRGRFHYQPPKEQVRGEFLKEVELE